MSKRNWSPLGLTIKAFKTAGMPQRDIAYQLDCDIATLDLIHNNIVDQIIVAMNNGIALSKEQKNYNENYLGYKVRD